MACRYATKEIIFGVLTLLLYISCNSSSKNKNIQEEKVQFFEDRIALKSGDLVCRLGSGFFSDYFRKLASKDKIYSHIGMTYIENDSIYVYHVEASEYTGIGQVKKEPISIYLEGLDTYGFYRINTTNALRNEIIENVSFYYTHDTPFDLDFDSFNDDKVYCTELIALGINKALKKEVIKPTINHRGRMLYGLDDLYGNEIMDSLYVKRY